MHSQGHFFIHLAWLFIGYFSVILACSATIQTIQLCDINSPPLIIANRQGEVTGGVLVDMTKAIFSQLSGVKVNMWVEDWQTCFSAVRDGEKDGVINIVYKQSREKFFVYTDSTYSAQRVLFYLKSKFPNGFTWNTFKDLSAYRIGIIKKANYGEIIMPAIEGKILNVVPTPSLLENIKRLKKKKIDFVLMNRRLGNYIINRMPSNNSFSYVAKPLDEYKYYMAFGKESSAVKLIPRINNAIKDLKENGRIEKITKVRKH